MLLHKGANSLQYLHVGPWIPRTHNAAVSQTTDRPCKYDKSGIIVWPKYSNVSLGCSWVCCSNKVLKQSNSFFASKGMHAFPFTSEINFPPWYTNLAVSSPLQWFFFSCLRQETNTGGFVLCCGGGWDPPTPPSDSTWCWEMRRETGVTHDLQCSNTTGLTIRGAPIEEGGSALLTSYFTNSPLIVFPLTDNY